MSSAELTASSDVPIITPGRRAPRVPDRARQILDWSARSWFVVAFLGQTIFIVYILALYARIATSGDPAAWNTVMPHGHVPGETLGNLVAASHVFLAAAITAGGMLQLIPRLRRRAPAFHRWVGRIYMAIAFVISVGGLYMVWGRGSVGDWTQHVAISGNALVVMLCAAVAWRHARARRMAQHRRWALRLFLAVSGVWFFRIGIMAWLLAHQRPVGFDPETFVGPFLTTLAFAQYLLPIAVLELYLRAQERGSAAPQLAVAGLIGGLTLVTALGVFGATVGMWLPRL